MKHIKSSKIFEARRRPEGPKLKKVEDLDEDIKQIFLSITDENLNLNLEAFHQYTSSSYTLYSVSIQAGLYDTLREEDNLLKDYLYDKIIDNYEDQAKLMLLISKELPEIRGRVKDIVGLKSFDISISGTISIKFDHEPEGYYNVGKKMLIGDQSKSMYY